MPFIEADPGGLNLTNSSVIFFFLVAPTIQKGIPIDIVVKPANINNPPMSATTSELMSSLSK
jgi:hypothetical protein